MTWGVFWRSTVLQPQKRAICAAAVCALIAGFAAPASAGEVATATGSSRATVVAPLTLVWVQDLKFGRITSPPTTGTVTVNPDSGACTVTGPIIETGGCQFAKFAGMGTRNFFVRINLPNTVTLTGPGANMTVDNLTLGLAPELSAVGNGNGNGNGNSNGNGNPRYSIVSNTGIFTFRVGGRLNVGANQASGVYSGTMSVTVVYQ